MRPEDEQRILAAAEKFREATEWLRRCENEGQAAAARVEEQERLVGAALHAVNIARGLLLQAARGE